LCVCAISVRIRVCFVISFKQALWILSCGTHHKFSRKWRPGSISSVHWGPSGNIPRHRLSELKDYQFIKRHWFYSFLSSFSAKRILEQAKLPISLM
jgi:hypothetical protein